MRTIRITRFLIIGLITLLCSCAAPNKTAFFVEGASLSGLSDHNRLRLAIENEDAITVSKEFVVTGHRLVSGLGMVIGVREFSKGTILNSDTSAFRKLTIYMPDPMATTKSTLSLKLDKSVIVFMSHSSANLPGITGCFGYASDGTLNLKSISPSEFMVDLDLIVDLKSPRGWKKECQQFHYVDHLTMQRKELNELSPWEGVVGKTLYDETIPP
jgi:hypothetical protein